MSVLKKLSRGWSGLFGKRRADRELADEVGFHLERQIERNRAAGMDPQAARDAALREFGAVEQVKEECRETRGVMLIEDFLQDVRFGWRMLRRAPGFAAVAVLTLTLGIGANTAIFSVVSAVLLRPLPYPDGNRLVIVETHTRWFKFLMGSTPPDIADWKASNHTLDSIAAFNGTQYAISRDAGPLPAAGAVVSEDFFRVMRIHPALGREFAHEEYRDGNNHVALLSYGLWQRLYGGDPNAVGRTIRLNLADYVIAGVLPQNFSFPPTTDIWTPVELKNVEAERGSFGWQVIARLKVGVTAAQAQRDFDGMMQQIAHEHPDSHEGATSSVTPLRRSLVGEQRTWLLLLLGAVGFVLLLACANVANLMLSRAATRKREMAIRTALGASRLRTIRQLLTESSLISFLGGALGWLLASWTTGLMAVLIPEDFQGVNEISMDGRVFLFTLAASCLAAALFGLPPALESARADLMETLKEGGRGGTSGKSASRLRHALMVSEVALAFLLAIGAGLLAQSLARMQSVSPGFRPEHVMSFAVRLPSLAYPQKAQQTALLDSLVERARALPGASSAAIIDVLPFSGAWSQGTFTIPGVTPPDLNKQPAADVAAISPDYFRAMGIPTQAGREFSAEDGAGSACVAIVDSLLVQNYFGATDPIGKQIVRQDKCTIVGVVGHVRNLTLLQDAGPEIYLPFDQMPSRSAFLVVRTAAEPGAATSAVRGVARSLDKDVLIGDVSTMDDRLSSSLAQPRFRTWLLASLAALALLLASVGIYGVMSFGVAQREHEIGVRMALGAERRDVLNLVLAKAMTLVAVGLGIGLIASLLLTRFLEGLLFEVKAHDPLTIVLVGAGMAVVALGATWIPAWRATRVDPMTTLRNE